MACAGAIGAARPVVESSPAIAVTNGGAPVPRVGAVSHTDHADTEFAVTLRLSGTPGIPIIGPVGYLAISDALTQVTAPALPTASRADVRLSAGYSRPLIFAYTAPVSRFPIIDDCPTRPAGFMTCSSAIQPMPISTKTHESATAACCLRSSCFIRTENLVIAAFNLRL